MPNRYAVAFYAYFGIRKCAQLWGADLAYDNKIRPMLLGDKIAIYAISMALAPALAPFQIKEDLNRIDIYMKGEQPANYGLGVKKRFVEHLL